MFPQIGQVTIYPPITSKYYLLTMKLLLLLKSFNFIINSFPILPCINSYL